jgi:AraC-like DNA-binding protein
MQAFLKYPRAELREAIEYYWFHEMPTASIKTYNIPFLNQELIINYGGQFSVSNASHQLNYDHQGKFTGLLQQPVVTTLHGRYKAIGIMFKPFGLYRLFGISGLQLSQQAVTPVEIWGDEAIPLFKQLQESGSHTEKLEALEHFLLQKLSPRDIPEEILQLQNPGTGKGYIQSCLSAALPSSKKYIAFCKDAVGYSPKRYSHLCLINTAIRQIAKSPAISLTSVAYDNGFYDQSHFVRIFKSVAGITPSAYRKAVQHKKIHADFPNTILL